MLATAGRVGRAHGLDGTFVLQEPRGALEVGMDVHVGGCERRVERLAGTPARPLVRLAGLDSREAVAQIAGDDLMVPADDAPLGEGEWLAGDLVGCRIEGLGRVVKVVPGPSCDVLELEDGTLVPLMSDAVTSVAPAEGRIEVNRAFLGLGP